MHSEDGEYLFWFQLLFAYIIVNYKSRELTKQAFSRLLHFTSPLNLFSSSAPIPHSSILHNTDKQ